MRLGLEAIDAICGRLGRPERIPPSVLVAGTNGKGSTAATLSAIARAAGVRCGLYTSPHLVAVTERVRVDDVDLPADALDAALGRVFAAADAAPPVPLTYFEAMTAAAFVAFAESAVDLAVLEVGLGGRFDATNVAPARLSVVTSIGLDHVAELGPTLAAIAGEKAGVFRAGRPALARAEAAEAREALAAAARAIGAEWHDAGRELAVAVERVSLDGTRFRLATPERAAVFATPLPGAHQAWNAALAVRAAELLAPGDPRFGRTAAIETGVAAVRWPGRLERFDVAGRAVLLDGCHNADGAEALASFLADAGLAGAAVLVFGAMADKDVEAIAAPLLPLFRRVFLAAPDNPRAAAPEELARRVAAVRPDAVPTAGVADALARALSLGDPAPIIVAGSLYLVGEARARLLSERGPTP
jgi:dihydrofolate synthase/folylpolyglutamate synthase